MRCLQMLWDGFQAKKEGFPYICGVSRASHRLQSGGDAVLSLQNEACRVS